MRKPDRIRQVLGLMPALLVLSALAGTAGARESGVRLVSSAGGAVTFEVTPHPASGFFQFFNCSEGNPAEPCLKGTNLYLNAATAPCLPPETAIGVGGSTWGAVKSLFDK